MERRACMQQDQRDQPVGGPLVHRTCGGAQNLAFGKPRQAERIPALQGKASGRDPDEARHHHQEQERIEHPMGDPGDPRLPRRHRGRQGRRRMRAAIGEADQHQHAHDQPRILVKEEQRVLHRARQTLGRHDQPGGDHAEDDQGDRPVQEAGGGPVGLGHRGSPLSDECARSGPLAPDLRWSDRFHARRICPKRQAMHRNSADDVTAAAVAEEPLSASSPCRRAPSPWPRCPPIRCACPRIGRQADRHGAAGKDRRTPSVPPPSPVPRGERSSVVRPTGKPFAEGTTHRVAPRPRRGPGQAPGRPGLTPRGRRLHRRGWIPRPSLHRLPCPMAPAGA
uniref:Uncharacterized protein n=1 Tax=Cereibacter sphaeroides TaxID=1063 RepID=O54077_CERSP|nr:hypothetical protein [Cereibacter sphaeroides]